LLAIVFAKISYNFVKLFKQKEGDDMTIEMQVANIRRQMFPAFAEDQEFNSPLRSNLTQAL
jgi:hypothetical protein